MVAEIICNIWIGNKKDSLDDEFILSKNINVIVNCTPSLPFIESNNSKIQRIEKIRIPVDDKVGHENLECNRKMQFYLDSITSHLLKRLKQGKKILVHCRQGRQRSGTIITALMMLITKMDVSEIIKLLQTKKTDIFYPSCNFAIALNNFKSNIK
jgi:protein-tyrosine phosphatase